MFSQALQVMFMHTKIWERWISKYTGIITEKQTNKKPTNRAIPDQLNPNFCEQDSGISIHEKDFLSDSKALPCLRTAALQHN